MAVGNPVFAVAVLFIAMRESLEASLVVGILCGMLESLVKDTNLTDDPESSPSAEAVEAQKQKRVILKKLRGLIFLGAGMGLFIAFAIGGAFLAVFYTQVNDLYSRAEELWEGIFNLVAVLLITPMCLALLRADRSRGKWRRKLSGAFEGKLNETPSQNRDQQPGAQGGERNATVDDSAAIAQLPQLSQQSSEIEVLTPGVEKSKPAAELGADGEKQDSKLQSGHAASESGSATIAAGTSSASTKKLGKIGRAIELFRSPVRSKGTFAIWLIPFVTVLREGLEGVVFIGGVSLGLPATSIPLPAIVGIAVGLGIGFAIFKSGSFVKVRYFLLISTCALLLIAAGMASRAVYYLQFYRYVQLVGGGAAESGSGPGSYDSQGYIWHLDCCNPEANKGGSGWSILNSLVGWNNTATYGSVLTYVFYWLAVTSYLFYSMYKEDRLSLVVRMPWWPKERQWRVWESKPARAKRVGREEKAAALAAAGAVARAPWCGK